MSLHECPPSSIETVSAVGSCPQYRIFGKRGSSCFSQRQPLTANARRSIACEFPCAGRDIARCHAAPRRGSSWLFSRTPTALCFLCVAGQGCCALAKLVGFRKMHHGTTLMRTLLRRRNSSEKLCSCAYATRARARLFHEFTPVIDDDERQQAVEIARRFESSYQAPGPQLACHFDKS